MEGTSGCTFLSAEENNRCSVMSFRSVGWAARAYQIVGAILTQKEAEVACEEKAAMWEVASINRLTLGCDDRGPPIPNALAMAARQS